MLYAQEIQFCFYTLPVCTGNYKERIIMFHNIFVFFLAQQVMSDTLYCDISYDSSDCD